MYSFIVIVNRDIWHDVIVDCYGQSDGKSGTTMETRAGLCRVDNVSACWYFVFFFITGFELLSSKRNQTPPRTPASNNWLYQMRRSNEGQTHQCQVLVSQRKDSVERIGYSSCRWLPLELCGGIINIRDSWDTFSLSCSSFFESSSCFFITPKKLDSNFVQK